MPQILRAIPPLLALLCLIAVVPWLLGVPGVDNDYARGWTIGLNAILFYLAFFVATLVLSLVARLAQTPIQPRWIDWLRLAGVAAFVIAQAVAWPLILR